MFGQRQRHWHNWQNDRSILRWTELEGNIMIDTRDMAC